MQIQSLGPDGQFYGWDNASCVPADHRLLSAEEIAERAKPSQEEKQQQVNAESRAYLASTDWYVIRMQETGEPVPDDVLAERTAARARVVE